MRCRRWGGQVPDGTTGAVVCMDEAEEDVTIKCGGPRTLCSQQNKKPQRSQAQYKQQQNPSASTLKCSHILFNRNEPKTKQARNMKN